MKRYYFAIVAAVLLCACASTRNTSRSSTQERVEERAESERQTSTQEQTEEQRDVVTISKTTTETKSTTTIYDTSSPAADSLGIPPPQQTTTTETKTTNTTATVDKSVIRQIVDEQLREAANEQTGRHKHGRDQRGFDTEEPALARHHCNLHNCHHGMFFRTPFCRSKISLYLCTDVVLRHRALCGCCFGDPAFLQKLSNCCQIFFTSIRNLLNIGFIR